DHSKLVTALAEGLGIDEAKAQEAVDKAIDEVNGDRKDRGPRTDDQSGTTKPESGQPSTAPQSGQPSAPSGTPSAPSQETRRETIAQRLAAVIADELDADEAKVLQIVQDNMPERPDRGERGDRGDRGDRGERGNRGDGSGRPDDSGNTATPSPEPTR